MPNPEHVAKLRERVDAWNVWRAQNRDIRQPNLIDADLSEANLGEANLSRAHLAAADLRRADLRRADLRGADLRGAKLAEAKLIGANLEGANLSGGMHLAGANLRGAFLYEANLGRANLTRAVLDETIFANVNLTDAVGLEFCVHQGPSSIDHRTLEQSGQLPLPFLRGCGLSDWEIESTKLYQPGLNHEQITDIVYRIDAIRAETPIQIHNLFISYSHADNPFVEHLEGHLRKRHIRFWRDVHDAPAGPLEKIVVRAMRQNPTVLLILSARSVASDWVEFEAKQARTLEKELDRHVLCPVALDDSWKTCNWSSVLRNQIEKYNILDFAHWQDANNFERMFERLLTGLDLFYEKAPAK